MSKTKHYSTVEKKIFVEILKEFKHVIEVKKSDSSSLRDKEIAWTEICNRYNDCTTILQERTVQQLKKLWANMKQNQRDILTKEKQACLATGGGPPLPETKIDPDVAIITPHLLKSAPVLFSSNMTQSEIDDNYERVVNAVQDSNMTICENFDDADELVIQNVEVIENINEEINLKQNILQCGAIEKKSNKENQNPYKCNEAFPMKRKGNLDTTGMRASKLMKEKRITRTFCSEDDIKIERIKHIMEQEKEMADIRKVHDKEIHDLEVRAALAKAELAELQLQNEKERFKKKD